MALGLECPNPDLGVVHHETPSSPRLLACLAEAAVAGLPRPPTPEHHLVICPQFRIGDQVIRTISMIARFDTALEVTLDEVAIELTYPEDATADRFFRELAKSRPAEVIGLVTWTEA